MSNLASLSGTPGRTRLTRFTIQGVSDGELSVDLRLLRSFSSDQSTGLAVVGSGTLLGRLNTELYESHGLYVPHGLTFSIGIGGHATVGGFGIASRAEGLTLDHVKEAEVVLANSSIVTCSETVNPDLFFAVRGAAASFGIVTSFTLTTKAAPTSIVNYAYVWQGRNSSLRADVFRSWQQVIYSIDLPWELSLTMTISPGAIELSGGFLGTKDQFNEINLGQYFPSPTVILQDVHTNFSEISNVWDQEIQSTGIGNPSYFYAKSAFFGDKTRIANHTVDAMIAHLDTAANGTQLWAVNFETSGGYMASIPDSSTAMPHRQARYAMLSYAQTSKKVSNTTFQFLDRLSSIAKSDHPGAYYGQYAGYIDPRQDSGEARRAYWAGNLERLQCIKARLDPHDVFHNEQSVLPIC